MRKVKIIHNEGSITVAHNMYSLADMQKFCMRPVTHIEVVHCHYVCTLCEARLPDLKFGANLARQADGIFKHDTSSSNFKKHFEAHLKESPCRIPEQLRPIRDSNSVLGGINEVLNENSSGRFQPEEAVEIQRSEASGDDFADVITMMFVTSALPFRLLENPYWSQAFGEYTKGKICRGKLQRRKCL